MNPATLADFMALALWLSLMALAVLGGADFGAGVWDLLAGGEAGERQRGALIRAIGPIWEANEIWLIFLVTGTWTAFSPVFYAVMTALFIPLTLALLGIVMRGAAFAYYTHFRAAVSVSDVWGRTFSVASTVTPFLFGAAAAAVASGRITLNAAGEVTANIITSWTTPFALSCGCLAVAACACLAATYMTVEANNQNMTDLLHLFRRRALISGALTAALGIISGWLASYFAPYLFSGLTGRALPIALAGIAAGLLTATALLIGLYRTARMLVGLAVALVLGAWAVAQLPYLIVPSLTIAQAASPPGVQAVVLIATLVSGILVLPSMYYMLYLFKARNRRPPRLTADQYIDSLVKRAESASEGRGLAAGMDGHDKPPSAARSVAAVVAAMGVAVAAGGATHLWQRFHRSPRN